jgi:hypothetical protein
VSASTARSTAAILVLTMLLVPVGGWWLVRSLMPVPRAVETPEVPVARPPRPAVPSAVVGSAAEIHGRILDANGDPVDGAVVRLVSVSSPHGVLRDTKSDSAGRFSFARLAPAAVRVVAEHDPDGAVSSAELDVADAGSIEITLVLSAAGSVLGTVVDSDDHPVAGAKISIEGAPWTSRSATSDAAGSFRLTAVPKEATSLVVVAAGYRTARVALARRDDLADRIVRVRLAAAPPVEGDVLDSDGQPTSAAIVACEGLPSEARAASAKDGTFQLPSSTLGCSAVARHDEYAPSSPVAVVEGRRLVLRLRAGGAIDGIVVDEHARGVDSFTVGIESFSGAQARSPASRGPRSFDDVRGVFRWDKLAPGSYVLTAATPGKPPTRSDVIDVVAGAATKTRIVLPEGGSVTGHVYDEHRAALEGVDVRFDSVSSIIESRASATTDRTGMYRIDGAPAGPFTLRVGQQGYRVRLLSGLRVDSHRTLTQDVALTAIDGGPSLELSGIGANLVQNQGGISLGAVFTGDPAERAGLRAGDHVLSVDGEDTDRMSVVDALQRLRGEAGTPVSVSVQRQSGEIVDVLITRAAIVR